MLTRIEETKAALWEQLLTVMRTGMKQSCQDGRKLHSQLDEHHHMEVQKKMERLFERVVERVRAEPEMEDIFQLFLGYPSQGMER